MAPRMNPLSIFALYLAIIFLEPYKRATNIYKK